MPYIIRYQSSAQTIDVWGAKPGHSRTYQIQREFNGSISGILDKYIVQYIVMDVFDNDLDNYTDIRLGIIDLSGTSTGIDMKVLSARAWWFFSLDWVRVDDDNIYFYGYSDSTLIHYILNPNPPSITTYPILPIYFNDSLYIGVNWTYAINRINSSILDYTAYDLGDTVKISCDRINKFNSYYGAYYNETGVILWNRSVGWLESIVYTRKYDNPLNFSIQTTIRHFTPKFQTPIKDVELGKIFCLIGLSVGITGLGTTIYLITKYWDYWIRDYNLSNNKKEMISK
ncbi:MAG: hypothetical protein ACTSQI_19820 [Candidatus Helarchaeota archaeon]